MLSTFFRIGNQYAEYEKQQLIYIRKYDYIISPYGVRIDRCYDIFEYCPAAHAKALLAPTTETPSASERTGPDAAFSPPALLIYIDF